MPLVELSGEFPNFPFPQLYLRLYLDYYMSLIEPKKKVEEITNLTFSTTLKSLIEEQTGINEQAWKKVPPCLLIY